MMQRGKKMKIKAVVITVMITAIGIVACTSQELEWEGTIEEIDGVQVVKNPNEPMYGEDILSLEEEISIGEAVGREEYMFSQVDKIAVGNNGDIYVLDIRGNHVKVFSKFGGYIQTIGKGGEGPGEFIRPRNLVCTTQGKLAVGGMLRISFFSLSGEFINSVNPTASNLVQFKIDSLGKIIAMCMSFSDQFTTFEIKKFSPVLDELITYISVQKPRSGDDGIFPFGPVLSWELLNNDKVIWGYPEDGYKLKIYDDEGTLFRIIQKEYIPEKVTQNDIDRALNIIDMSLDTETSAPAEKPSFRKIFVDDEGKIFVQTWEFLPNAEGLFYDIFDADGRYISKAPLNFEPMLIKQGKLYTIAKDVDGYQYVKRYKVTWNY
jgi:hypothetical protein